MNQLPVPQDAQHKLFNSRVIEPEEMNALVQGGNLLQKNAMRLSMMQIIVAEQDKDNHPKLHEAMMTMLHSNKTMEEKLEYALKLALLAVEHVDGKCIGPKHVEKLQKTLTKMRATQDTVVPIDVSALVMNLAYKICVQLLGFFPLDIHSLVVKGNCWLTLQYQDFADNARWKRISICIDDILADFYTYLPRMDRETDKGIIDALPLGCPERYSELDEYIQPFLEIVNQQQTTDRYKMAKDLTWGFFSNDQFV